MKLFVKYLALFAISFLIASYTSVGLDLEKVRKNYPLSAKDKSICKTMIAELSQHIESNVHLAYLGAFQAIMANHVFSPLEKLSTFNQGRKNIDKAVQQSPLDPEIRFVRLSIQKNSPAFLGYNNQIDEDQAYLKGKIESITSVELKNQVRVLINSR